jgi:hypothetical protein
MKRTKRGGTPETAVVYLAFWDAIADLFTWVWDKITDVGEWIDDHCFWEQHQIGVIVRCTW